ncbi:hypothetical protein EXIGLDRAFT_748881 [Exidia glandulosa HHB12029]|uniref:Uncharacterized protein n=1 Tax=Exidia glandulosa HHB12029 TaxID=1314781 RepID=A0A165IV25_EXIGL|nr:hypothetical protein EXIGLDRAFT_748881 [Exidia glandulosa HHB12029]
MNYSESDISKEDWLSRFDKRIEHLLAKSSYVRDLNIVDDTRSFATAVEGPLAFTPEFLDRAMPAIRACTGVTKLCLWDGAHKEGALWPAPIWDLVQNACPVLEELCLCANFVDIPKLEGPLFGLAALTLRWCASLIDVFLPQEILFTSDLQIRLIARDEAPPPASQRFVLPSRLAECLVDLNVEMPHWSVPGPVIDVTALSHVNILLYVYFACEYKHRLPPAWRKIKPHLAGLVSDDIRAYNVWKSRDDSCVYIRRPSLVAHPGHKGRFQDQERDAAIDWKEQAEMDEYHRARRPGVW